MERFILEEHLNNWNLSPEDLMEKYGMFEHYTISYAASITTSDEDGNSNSILFGGTECHASFHYLFNFSRTKPDSICLRPLTPRELWPEACPNWLEEFQKVNVEFNRKLIESLFGDKYEKCTHKLYDGYGYVWQFPEYSISTYDIYDAHGHPNGGDIYISFKKKEPKTWER